MNHAVKKLTSAALALAMAMSMGVLTLAAPAATDYSINLSDNAVQFVQNGKVTATYEAKDSSITVKENASGDLLISFVKADTNSAVGVNLKDQSEVVFSGVYGSLTLDKTLPSDKKVTVSGSVGALTVSAPIGVTLGSTAKVTSLKVTDSKAAVAVTKGASVTKASAVDPAKVTGITGVTKLSASAATTGTAKTTTTKNTTSKTTSSTSSTKEVATSKDKKDGTLDMNEADETKFTKDIYFSDDATVEFTAKAGYSLGSCMRDVKLTVENDNGNKVSGKWNWITGDYNTKTSGTYKYQFVPSLSNQYNPITVNVVYTSSGTSSSISKPGLSFASGEKSHGDGERVSIEVDIPDEVEDDDNLIIYVDGDVYDEHDVDEGDAGEEDEYTLDLTKYYEKDEKIKIKVKIERSTGSKSATSKTITYTFD